MAAVFALIGVPMSFTIAMFIAMAAGGTLGVPLAAALVVFMMILFVWIIRFVHRLEDEAA